MKYRCDCGLDFDFDYNLCPVCEAGLIAEYRQREADSWADMENERFERRELFEARYNPNERGEI